MLHLCCFNPPSSHLTSSGTLICKRRRLNACASSYITGIPSQLFCVSDCCLLREASCEGDAIPVCQSSHLAGGSSCIPGVPDCLEAVLANSNLPDEVPHVNPVLFPLYLMLYIPLLHLYPRFSLDGAFVLRLWFQSKVKELSVVLLCRMTEGYLGSLEWPWISASRCWCLCIISASSSNYSYGVVPWLRPLLLFSSLFFCFFHSHAKSNRNWCRVSGRPCKSTTTAMPLW